MNISSEEKIMYKVMKALYDSGIPISFKGSMVLKAFLTEAGFSDDTRHTVDIDGNWNSDAFPTAEQMVDSFQKALDDNDLELEVILYRMYGEKRSAGFELKYRTSDEVLFTMDIDVNRPKMPTRIYEVDDIIFRGLTPNQMIADKVSVLSSDKIFRRIKDLVDLFYMSHVFELNAIEIKNNLKQSGRVLGDFNGFINRKDELKHSYEKFRFSGGVSKPEFDVVYDKVYEYVNNLI